MNSLTVPKHTTVGNGNYYKYCVFIWSEVCQCVLVFVHRYVCGTERFHAACLCSEPMLCSALRKWPGKKWTCKIYNKSFLWCKTHRINKNRTARSYISLMRKSYIPWQKSSGHNAQKQIIKTPTISPPLLGNTESSLRTSL